MGEEKEDHLPFLSLNDFKERGIKINRNWSGLEALRAIACLASEKLEEEKKRKENEEKERKTVENGRLVACKGFEYGSSSRSGNDRRVWLDEVSDRNGREKSLAKPDRNSVHDKYSKKGKEFVVDFDNHGSSPGSKDNQASLARISDRREREKILKKPLTSSASDMYSKKKQGFKVATRDKLLCDAMKARILPWKDDDDDQDWGDNSRKKDSKSYKKVKKERYIVPRATPDLPQNFREKIENLNGSKINLVIQKCLFATDVSNHHDRLSIPLNQILSIANFLNDDERNKLESGKDMSVIFIDPNLQESKIILGRWPKADNRKKKSFSYVLKTQWKLVVYQNRLEIGDIIQVWSFRKPGDELCLALVLVSQRVQIDEEYNQNNHGDFDAANSSEGTDGGCPTNEGTGTGSNPTSDATDNGCMSPICEGMASNTTQASNPTP